MPFGLGMAHTNLTYCNGQTLDLYIPRAATAPMPVAMYVHGGSMTAGEKGDLDPDFRDALATEGYAVATINYRLAPKSHFPAQIQDVKCAVRYLRAQSSAYGLDRSEIFAFGTSVGGQLVALDALAPPGSAWDAGAYPSEPSNVTAVADLFGPANLTEAASGYSSSGIRDVFGSNTQQNLVLASPTHYVAPNAPPILLIQGVDDTKVLKSQAIELYTDLQAAGDQTQLILVQNMGHMFAQAGPNAIDPSKQQLANDVASFFDKVRGEARPRP